MSLYDSHAIRWALSRARNDPEYRKQLTEESVEFWKDLLSPLVRDNLNGEYHAEFAIYEYVLFLQEAILETGMVKRAFDGFSIPFNLIQALHQDLIIMFEPTSVREHSQTELDLLMSIYRLTLCQRPFVLSEMVLDGRIQFVYFFYALLQSLSQSEDKERAYQVIGKFSSQCRSRFNFNLDEALRKTAYYSHFEDDDLNHLVKGYAQGQPLAQFVEEVFSGGPNYQSDESKDAPLDEDLVREYSNFLLHRYNYPELARRASIEDRQIILDRLSKLLESGFLTESDFFSVPVCIYTTDNPECMKWFSEHFGGQDNFVRLWMDSFERNPCKVDIDFAFGPNLLPNH